MHTNINNFKVLLIEFLTLIIVIVPLGKVLALENNNNYYVYTNKNGINFTEKEYNFIVEYYNQEFIESMTIEDYNWLENLSINDSDNIEIKTTNYLIETSLTSTSHTTSSKSFSIAKSCKSGYCNIYTKCSWLVTPKIKSYDVIGARFSNTSLKNNDVSTRVSSKSGTTYFSINKNNTNGIGASVKLPDNSENLIIEQRFIVKKQGKVYASYQHAISNISLKTSMMYNISSSGYGNVFSFYGSAKDKFDEMKGISINLE